MHYNWFKSAIIFIFLFLSGLIVSHQLSKNISGGIYDEVAHADMVYQTYERGYPPKTGSVISDWSLTQAGCRGFIPANPSFEACEDGTYDVNDLAKDGLNTASGYPPVYYLISAYSAKALDFSMEISKFPG